MAISEEKSANIQGSSFMQDSFTAIINEAKPYRNIVKRYWTEEEVRLSLSE